MPPSSDVPLPPPLGPGPAPARRAATDAEARALASALRVRILRMTVDRALTNKEIAQALERNPATVLHHVRTLVDTGFLHAEQPRRGVRGSREVPYRATGKSWYVEVPDGAPALLEAFVTEAARVAPEDLRLTRLGLRLKPADRDELERRLGALMEEYHDRTRDPEGEPWSLFLALHPDTSAQPPGQSQPPVTG